jgi:hypothetical protein
MIFEKFNLLNRLSIVLLQIISLFKKLSFVSYFMSSSFKKNLAAISHNAPAVCGGLGGTKKKPAGFRAAQMWVE